MLDGHDWGDGQRCVRHAAVQAARSWWHSDRKHWEPREKMA
jgi:hypothetical protein